MKIKTKLILSVGLLFGMILLLTALNTIHLNRLNRDTKSILDANYNTLEYLRNMQIALDDGIAETGNQELFEENLARQRDNITETGEKELTDSLARDIRYLKQHVSDTLHLHQVRNRISAIMLLNMEAIQRKSAKAQKTVETSVFWITIVGTISFLIALVMLFNLPGNVADPIKELTGSIKEIAAENYSQRVHFDRHDEFGELSAAFNTMAEKLAEYKAGNLEKLMMEKKRIETLINNMHDPVIGVDESKRVLFMNEIALKITGLTGKNPVGKPIQDIALHNDLIRTLALELFEIGGERKINTAPIKIFADNKESYFEKEVIPIKIVPTGEKEEKHIGNVILLQNITPYKELDFAKTNFISTVSHELKTPISAIKLSVQLLENQQVGPLNEEQIHLLDSIREDAGRLLRITGELLNMTQVESGIIQISVIASDVKEIIDYAINANRAAADQKQIRLETDIPEDIPRVLADSEKTSWVLTNLISNAIRYSYENSVVHILVAMENDHVKFSVTDTGQGIPSQYVDRIFDRYFRIPGTKKEGTGLGLSISKEFIEAQGGQLTVKSEYGEGSTFCFILNKVNKE